MADGERPQKRVRHEDDRLVVLDLLACVGDRAKDYAAVCEQISLVIEPLQHRLSCENSSREAFNAIGDALLRCGTELPFKASVYATIAGLITATKDQPYATELARGLGSAVLHELSCCIRDGKAAKAKRVVRFLAELANASVVSVDHLASTLSVLLSAAETELSQSSRGENNIHARGQFLAEVAISALFWCGKTLQTRARELLDTLLKLVDAVHESWAPNRWRAIALGDNSFAAESLSEILVALAIVRQSDWRRNEDVAPAYQEFFAEKLATAPSVDFEPFKLPGHSKLSRYSPPRFRLCLLTGTETAEATEIHSPSQTVVAVGGKNVTNSGLTTDENGESNALTMSEHNPSNEAAHEAQTESDHNDPKREAIDRYFRRQYVADVLDNFVPDHVKGAERLLTMSMLSGANDVVVETLFSEMCSLPTPPNPAIYYGTVFVDLCKVKDSRLPIKLLTAVEKIFQDAGSLDPEVFDRLSEWFSFHLSNFGYQWNWADWAVYADSEMVERFPFRALFCRDVLDRSVRLSYYERISKIVPEDMAFFLPSPMGSGNTTRFSPDVTDKLVKIIAGEGKQPPEVVKERLIEILPLSQFEGNESEANLARLVALLRAILKGSSRTLSHFDTLTERYLTLLSSMSAAGGVTARKAVALEAGTFWSSSHLRTLYVLDKLSTYRIIDGLAILDYLFSDINVNERGEAVSMSPLALCVRLEQSPRWEMCRLVYSRARSRLEGARQELTAASGAASHAAEGDAEQVEARLESAKSGAQNAKLEIRQLVLLGFRRLFLLSDMIFSAQEGMDVDEISDKSSESSWKPSHGKVFSWRALGMVREIARKHPEQVEALLDDIRAETAESRARHPSLQESFEIIEEISGSDIHLAA